MPDWKSYVRSQLPTMHVKPAREIEIIEELAAQLDQTYQDELASGQTAAEAEQIAKSQMPDWKGLARDIETSVPPRHQPPSRFWSGIPTDIRHAFRVLAKSPLFAVVAIATLAIGIGGCTAIFSLVEAVILRPIGYRQPEQLAMVWESQPKNGTHNNVVAMADYLDWKARNHVFAEMSPILDQIWNVTGNGDAIVWKGIASDSRFLALLGVEPLIGRSFTTEETVAGGPQVVILSHKIWVERFNASRDALGQKILLDGEPRTIVGVLPAGFPWLGQPLDVLTPTQFRERDWRKKAGRFMRVVGRLKPGVTAAQAQNEMSSIASQLEVEYPEFNKDWSVDVVPMAEHFVGEAGTALWVLMGSVGLVLLIACSNVANLMLARSVVREREMALRAALGATRGRILRQLAVESLVLAGAGGLLGCGGALVAVRLIQVYGPQDVTRLNTAGFHWPVALFVLAASCVTGLAFGLAPALAARSLNLGAALKDGGRGVLNTLRGEKLRGAFVVVQVGLASVLLIGALLLIQSIYRLSAVAPGFDAHNVLTGSVMMSGNSNGAKLESTCREMVERLRGLPGFENAGFITWLPFAGMGAATGFSVVGRPPYAPGQTPVADVRVVQPGYFETMRIKLLRGRLFNEADSREKAPRGFVVSEALVRQTFGNNDPLGQSLTVQMGDDKPGQIIGVVGDTKQQSLDGEIRPLVYFPQGQLPIGMGTFVVRTRGKPELLASAMTAAIQQVTKDQPVTDIRSMDDWIGRSTAQLRFQAALLGAFALIAVVLAVVGVYGVMAYSVEQRTHEIGVRLALGAEPGVLLRWVTLRGVRLAAVGLVVGILGAAAATRVLGSLLFGVSQRDPLTFLSAMVLLSCACLLASYLPARRATLVDPVVTLRGE